MTGRRPRCGAGCACRPLIHILREKYAPLNLLVIMSCALVLAWRFWSRKVLCTATLEHSVPPFLRDGKGWITANMPCCLVQPVAVVSAVKKPSQSRSIEIQRLIGRSLRAAVSLEALGGIVDHRLRRPAG